MSRDTVFSTFFPVYPPTQEGGPSRPGSGIDFSWFHISRFVGSADEYQQAVCPGADKRFLDCFLKFQGDVLAQFGIHYQIVAHPMFISRPQTRALLHRLQYAFDYGYNISNQPGLELLLYLSLQRQITEALTFAGVADPKDDSDQKMDFVQLFFGPHAPIAACLQWAAPKFKPANLLAWSPPEGGQLRQIRQRYAQRGHLPPADSEGFELWFNTQAVALFLENVRPTKLYEASSQPPTSHDT